MLKTTEQYSMSRICGEEGELKKKTTLTGAGCMVPPSCDTPQETRRVNRKATEN